MPETGIRYIGNLSIDISPIEVCEDFEKGYRRMQHAIKRTEKGGERTVELQRNIVFARLIEDDILPSLLQDCRTYAATYKKRGAFPIATPEEREKYFDARGGEMKLGTHY